MPRHHGLQAGGDCCVTLSMPCELAAARTARRHITAALEAVGARTTVVQDAALVTSELVSNGVLHGRPDAHGMLSVSWCLDEQSLLISVVDGGDSGTLRPLALTDDAVSGRGLAIVDSLCSTWTVDHAQGTRVTAELVLG